MPDGTLMTGKKHNKNSKPVSRLVMGKMNQEKVKLNKKDKKEVKRNNLKKEVKKKPNAPRKGGASGSQATRPKKPNRRY